MTRPVVQQGRDGELIVHDGLRVEVVRRHPEPVRYAIVVGEMNPYRLDPRLALWDEPDRASGARLRRIFGLHRHGYRWGLDRRNLCVGKWNDGKAREAASAIAAELRPGAETPYDQLPIVMLGRKVATAFGLSRLDPFTASGRFVAIPHPSGLCRDWNAPGAVERARVVLRAAIPDVPWGVADEDRS